MPFETQPQIRSLPLHQWLNPATTSKTKTISTRFGRRSGDKCSLCPAPTPTQSTLWGFGTMSGVVDGVVLAGEPLSPLRRRDRLRNGIAYRCVRRGVYISCLWTTAADLRAMVGVFVVLLSLAFFCHAPNQKKNSN